MGKIWISVYRAREIFVHFCHSTEGRPRYLWKKVNLNKCCVGGRARATSGSTGGPPPPSQPTGIQTNYINSTWDTCLESGHNILYTRNMYEYVQCLSLFNRMGRFFYVKIRQVITLISLQKLVPSQFFEQFGKLWLFFLSFMYLRPIINQKFCKNLNKNEWILWFFSKM